MSNFRELHPANRTKSLYALEENTTNHQVVVKMEQGLVFTIDD
jgi:hypothetical protein